MANANTFRLASPRYKPVFASKEVFRGKTLVMWVKRGARAGRRTGVVVSKRTFRLAVDRNRAKRLMREAFRTLRSDLAPDVEVVLVARHGIAGRHCGDVCEDLRKVAKRAGVLLQSGLKDA